jgi:DNA-binding MarR family transcriptional regulator
VVHVRAKAGSTPDAGRSENTDPSKDTGASTNTDPSEADVAFLLQRLIASAVLYNHEVAQRLGLGSSDSQFMTLLQVLGPLTPGRLAQLSGLTTGTVTGVIDRLEGGGFVRRERDPGDRRRVVVVLDEQAARERVLPHYAQHAVASREALARRTPAERTAILRFLRDLIGPRS